MKFLSRTAVFISSLFLGACSVYQSDGRKFLEKEAFEYSGAQAYLLKCPGAEADVRDLELTHSDSRAQVFRFKNSQNIRVLTHQQPAYACDYGFANALEVAALQEPAIELTIRLGEFANSQIYPLK